MVIATDLVKEFTKTEKVKKKNVKTTFRAVDGISIEAKDGETLGILGPNGAGKTTLLRMLGTLMEPTSGTAARSGISFSDFSGGLGIDCRIKYLHSLRLVEMTFQRFAYFIQ